MTNPSPLSHLYRLGILAIICVVGFLVIRDVATPSSWNYDVWYRADTLKEAENQPLVHGGNESCRACHDNTVAKVAKLKHKRLSCEGCHGALADHVRNDEKIADALMVRDSTWQCLNCHGELISKPPGFPQFTDEVNKHKEVEQGAVCLKCHDAHDPTP